MLRADIKTDFGTDEEELNMVWHSEEYKDIKEKLILFLNKDLKQARIRYDEEGYDEEYNIEGDWQI